MSNLVLLKRSAVASKVPATTDLLLGEIALNTYDGKVFMKKHNGVDGIVEVGAVTTVAGRTGAVVLANTDVGLGNVENKSSATIRSELTGSNVTTALGYTPANAATYGAANGVATLDGNGKIVTSQLPAIAITDTFVVASEAAMLALSVQTGDIAVRTDLNKSFIVAGVDGSVIGNWQELLTPSDVVQSVNGKSGAITLSTTDILEGTNKYYTDARARAAISATGSLAYNSATGVISYTAPTSGTGSGDFKSDGSVAMTGAIKTIAGTVGAPSIVGPASTATGISFNGPNIINISTSGVGRIQLTDTYWQQNVATMFGGLNSGLMVFNGNLSGFGAIGTDNTGGRLWMGKVTDQSGATITSKQLTLDFTSGVLDVPAGITASTVVSTDNSAKVATTAFVKAQNYITAAQAPVQTVAGKSGAVTLVVADVSGAAPSASPSFSGQVKAANGTSAAPAFSFTAAPNYGVNYDGDGFLKLVANGTATLTSSATDIYAQVPFRPNQGIFANLGTAAAVAYGFSGDNGTGIYGTNDAPSAARAINFGVNGVNKLLITLNALTSSVPIISPTPATADNSTTVATTAFVKAQSYVTAAGAATAAPVQTVAGRTGNVVLTMADVSGTVDGGSF